jgi:hypothetical protein
MNVSHIAHFNSNEEYPEKIVSQGEKEIDDGLRIAPSRMTPAGQQKRS